MFTLKELDLIAFCVGSKMAQHMFDNGVRTKDGDKLNKLLKKISFIRAGYPKAIAEKNQYILPLKVNPI